MLLVCIFLFPSLAAGFERNNELPDFVRRCRNDANVSECSIRTLEDLRPYMMRGIPEFRLPPIGHLDIPPLTLDRQDSNVANYHAKFTDVVWTGTGDFQVTETFVDLGDLVFRLSLKIPLLVLDAFVNMTGTVLSFEIDGAGTVLIDFSDVTFDIVMNGERFDDERREFVRWQAEDVGIMYDEVYYSELNGFFSDPSVTHLFKLAINRSIRLLGATFRPLLATIPNFIVEAINRVYAMYPSDVLYN